MSTIFQRTPGGSYYYENEEGRVSLHTDNRTIALKEKERRDEKAELRARGLPDKDKTWADLWAEYQKAYKPFHAARSFEKLCCIVKNFIGIVKPESMDGVWAITRPVCDDWRAARLQEVTPNTLRTEIGYIGPIFQYAHNNGYISINPFADIKPMKFIRREASSLTYPQVQKFLAVVHGTYPEYDLIARFAYETGMRLNEILHQRWQDVDLEGSLIKVAEHLESCQCIQCLRNEKRYGKSGWVPKNVEERYVPISRDLRAALLQVPEADRGGLLFKFSDNGIGKRFGKLHATVGNPEGIRFHVFRHTMASDMERAGVRGAVISAILGHSIPLSSDGSAMTRRYTHAFVGECKLGMKRLTEWRDQQKVPLVEKEVEGIRIVAVA